MPLNPFSVFNYPRPQLPARPKQFQPPGTQPPGIPIGVDIPLPENLREVQSTEDPSKIVPGSIEYRGPRLNTEEALSGLRAAQTATPPRIPTEELFRGAAVPDLLTSGPYSVGKAPGSQAFSQHQLKERIGEDEFSRLLGQKEQEVVRSAQAGLSPPVQQQAERAARRAAYPAQEQAKALTLQSMFGLQGRQATAEGQVEGRRAARDAAALNYLQRSIDELASRESLRDEDLAMLDEFRNQVQQIRRGEFFLTDFGFSEDELEDMAELESQFGQ